MERKESTGKAEEAPMLCIKPNVCPISCAITYIMDSSTTSWGIFFVRTRSSTWAVCTKRQLLINLMISLYTITLAFRISPVTGSTHDGPIAFIVALGE